MLLLRLFERCLGFLSVLVLARILVPADFGLIAMAMSVIAFVELGGAFGFELALIQKEHPTRQHYDTAWTLQLAFGGACAMITAALAYPTAVFYAEPRVQPIMLVLAATWIIQSFENIGIVEFRRQLNFSRDFAFLASKKFVGFTVTLALALTLQTYWALVAGMVAGRVTGVVLSYVMQPYRPRFSLAARRDLFSFSGWIFVNSLVAFAGSRLPHFVVGRLHGSAMLGLYTVGSEIAQLPATELVAPISRAVFPGYSRVAGDVDVLRRSYVDLIAVIAVFVLPMSFGIAVVAEPTVQLLLGDKWAGAAMFIQILAFAGAVHAMCSNNYSVWLALGKARLAALVQTAYVVALIPLILVLAHGLGAIGVAWAELSASVFGLVISYLAVNRVLRLSFVAYLASLWRPVTAATLMAFAVSSLVRASTAEAGALVLASRLAFAIALGVVIYVCALTLLWLLAAKPHGGETIVLARLAKLVRGRRAAPSGS